MPWLRSLDNLLRSRPADALRRSAWCQGACRQPSVNPPLSSSRLAQAAGHGIPARSRHAADRRLLRGRPGSRHCAWTRKPWAGRFVLVTTMIRLERRDPYRHRLQRNAGDDRAPDCREPRRGRGRRRAHASGLRMFAVDLRRPLLAHRAHVCGRRGLRHAVLPRRAQDPRRADAVLRVAAGGGVRASGSALPRQSDGALDAARYLRSRLDLQRSWPLGRLTHVAVAVARLDRACAGGAPSKPSVSRAAARVGGDGASGQRDACRRPAGSAPACPERLSIGELDLQRRPGDRTAARR